MKDLKVGDEKWVIACKETENGFEFMPLFVRINSVSKRTETLYTDRWEVQDCNTSFVVNYVTIERHIRNMSERVFDNEKKCREAIKEWIEYLHRTARSSTAYNKFPNFVMI